MSKVFVATRNTRFDLKPAEVYGDIVYVMDPGKRGAISPWRTSEVVRELKRRLAEENFDYEKDYVALTGTTIFVSLLLTVAMCGAPDRRVKMLMFDARQEEYTPRDVLDPYAKD